MIWCIKAATCIAFFLAAIGKIAQKIMCGIRWRLGRLLMHLGLNVLPQGRARSEISDMLWEWRAHVEATLAAHRSPQEAK